MLQKQSVGEHSWQMYRIYCVIWGPPSAAAAELIMKHDAGEIGTGDMPLYAKRDDPVLKRQMDLAEHSQQALSGLLPVLGTTDQEKWRVKMCDLLEGLEHCVADVAMGNSLAMPALQNYAEAATLKINRWAGCEWDGAAQDAGLAHGYLVKIREFVTFTKEMETTI